MSAKQYSHMQVVSSDVIHAFTARRPNAGHTMAGRVVSGLLKAAVKAGTIEKATSVNPFGEVVRYKLTDAQLASIRAAAIERAKTI